jgi:aminoglycoside phosphotransferase family enzyme/predicted kinase
MSSQHVTQEQVLSFLGSPAAYRGSPVKQINTHAASVFLSGTRALKIKRAVKFPFLDYTTLDLRRRACLAEIEVNRPFAPELYLGLVRITKEADGSLQIAGTGEVVEWAVEMLRFDDALTLDRYGEEHVISADMARTIVKRLAEVHKTAPQHEADSWIVALEGFLAQHNQVFREHSDLFQPEQVRQLFNNGQKRLEQIASLTRDRAAAGFLVRGHGDLHLGNIALIKGQPIIFDAVEFDPLIAAGDVLYDLAFLIMDMLIGGHREAANSALNDYLQFSDRSENLAGLALLPFFMSLRSAIRAVVAIARHDQIEKSSDAKAAQRYFHAAIGFLEPKSPRLVAIGGLSGTGKSFLAKLVATHILPEPGALILRSDIMRKRFFGVGEYTRLDASAYSERANEIVYGSLFRDARKALAAGHSVILDAVFRRSDERLSAEQAAVEARVPFDGLFLQADLVTRIERVETRIKDASDADRSVAVSQEAESIGELKWKVIDSSGGADQTLAKALTALGLNTATPSWPPASPKLTA